jgi:glycosyltransferase involved in cell wall biosynthesis
MILTTNAISVVLGVRNNKDVLQNTLPLWARVCASYTKGSELVICDDGSDDGTSEFVEEFMEAWKNGGLKIAYIKRDYSGDLSPARIYNAAKDYVESPYVMFATGDSYPKGKLLLDYMADLNDGVVLLGLREYIKGFMDYTMVKREGLSNDARYYDLEKNPNPENIFIGNNFVVPKKLLEEVGWVNTRSSVYRNGRHREYTLERMFLDIRAKTDAKLLPVPDAKVLVVKHI